MVFIQCFKKIRRCNVVCGCLEIQFIAERRVFHHGNDRRFTSIALIAFFTLNALFTGITFIPLFTLRSGITLVTFFALNALFTGIAFLPLFALWTDIAFGTLYAWIPFWPGRSFRAWNALLALRAGASFIALNTLRAKFSLRTLHAGRPLFPCGSPVAFFSPVPFWSRRSHGTGISLRSDRTFIAFRPDGTRVSLNSLQADFASVALRADISPDALRASRTHWSGGTSRSLRARASGFAFDAARSHWSLFSSGTLLAPGTFRSHRSLWPLDRHISTVGLAVSAAAVPGAVVVVWTVHVITPCMKIQSLTYYAGAVDVGKRSAFFRKMMSKSGLTKEK